jgi:hypothetical protein
MATVTGPRGAGRQHAQTFQRSVADHLNFKRLPAANGLPGAC